MATTALRKYQRLEATALWRPAAGAQRVEVVISIGEATLTICDMRERVLTHWSLAAIARANPGELPAIYHPDGDPGETLELAETEGEMIAAIETLRRAIARRRPRPGRLRLAGILASVGALALVMGLWLPGAARDHAMRLVPDAKRAEIGGALYTYMRRAAGPACRTPGGAAALDALARRLPPREGEELRLEVLRSAVPGVLRLPGGTTLIRAALVEDHDTPDVVAGHVIAALVGAEARAPFELLLREAGFMATLRLMATGELTDATLRAHAETLLVSPPAPPPTEALLQGFAHWQVRATPYARARDVTGETVLDLIEGDPFPRDAELPPVLSDGDWLRLQGICGG